MMKLLKILLFIVLGLIVFAILFFASDGILSRISASVKESQLPKKYDLYVMSNDVHTDLVFPVKSDIIDWSEVFPITDIKRKDSAYQYVAIGWGDKGFYLNTPEWKDLTLKTALVAALGLGETALHVTYYHKISEDRLTYKVSVDSLQFVKLKDYILDGYDKGGNGKPIYIETTAQYGDSDAFYEAKGSYSMFYSCNTWANQGLKQANMPSAIWTVFDKGILRHYGYKK